MHKKLNRHLLKVHELGNGGLGLVTLAMDTCEAGCVLFIRACTLSFHLDPSSRLGFQIKPEECANG